MIAGGALAGSKTGERISFRQPHSSGHGWLVLRGDLNVLRLLAACCDAGNRHRAIGKTDEEQQVVSDEPPARPYFHSKEITRR